MRTLAIWGFASAIAVVPAATPVSADSGRSHATMSTGVAPGASARGWGNVPNAPLNPPAPRPGSWGPGGWSGANPGSGGPGAPGGPMPGGPMGPGPGGPGHDGPHGGGSWHGGGQPGGWHGGQGNWHGGAAGGWKGGHGHIGRGQVLPRFWLSPRYFIPDWWSYGLFQPGYGQNWLRYYDDALLIDGAGRVLDYRYGLDWDRRGEGPGPDGYDHGDYDRGDGGGYDERPVVTGPGGVTVHSRGGTTVVVVQNPPVVTTTTTTTTYETVVGRRTWHHKRTWRPRCRCR